MKGKRILGIIVVMAMLMTAIPVLSGSAKASSGNSDHVPSSLVIVRKGYGGEIGEL